MDIREHHLSVKEGGGSQRLAGWRGAMGPTGSIEIDAAILERFEADLRSRIIGPLMIVEIRADTFRFVRDARAIERRGGRDHLFVDVLERGRIAGRLNGREVSIDAGSVFLSALDGTQDLEIADATWIGLVLPRVLVEEHFRWPRTLNGRVFAPASMEATLLASHLRSLMALPLLLDDPEAERVQRATVRHVGECLGLRSAPSDSAGTRSPDAAAIRGFIARHIDDPEMGPDFVCRSFAISRSNLYRLVGPGGIHSIVLDERLKATRRDIVSGRFAGRPLKQIFHDRGVGDLGGFRRAFVKKFGHTPSDLRARTDRPAEGEARAQVVADIEDWFEA